MKKRGSLSWQELGLAILAALVFMALLFIVFFGWPKIKEIVISAFDYIKFGRASLWLGLG